MFRYGWRRDNLLFASMRELSLIVINRIGGSVFMNIVSIVNLKGGVAKTTTCANLGACLAKRGLRVLLIDLDPQANLTLGLRDEWEKLPYGLNDVLLAPESAPLAGVIRQVGEMSLFLAPGHMDMARCE